MAAKRIYLIEEVGVSQVRLVRASTPAQAIRHVVRLKFKAEVADQEELVTALKNNAQVEDATEDAAE